MSTRRRGRPRDTTIDDRALDAARDLLLAEGYAATTIHRIAEQSGIHSSAIYRRWPSRTQLIQDAVLGDLAPRRVRPTGELNQDLNKFLRAYVATLRSPLLRAAAPALFSRLGADARRTPEAWALLSLRPHFRTILDAAPSGSINRTIDADEIFDLLLGAALVHAFVPDEANPPAPIERTVELIMQMMTPSRT